MSCFRRFILMVLSFFFSDIQLWMFIFPGEMEFRSESEILQRGFILFLPHLIYFKINSSFLCYISIFYYVLSRCEIQVFFSHEFLAAFYVCMCVCTSVYVYVFTFHVMSNSKTRRIPFITCRNRLTGFSSQSHCRFSFWLLQLIEGIFLNRLPSYTLMFSYFLHSGRLCKPIWKKYFWRISLRSNLF